MMVLLTTYFHWGWEEPGGVDSLTRAERMELIIWVFQDSVEE